MNNSRAEGMARISIRYFVLLLGLCFLFALWANLNYFTVVEAIGRQGHAVGMVVDWVLKTHVVCVVVLALGAALGRWFPRIAKVLNVASCATLIGSAGLLLFRTGIREDVLTISVANVAYGGLWAVGSFGLYRRPSSKREIVPFVSSRGLAALAGAVVVVLAPGRLMNWLYFGKKYPFLNSLDEMTNVRIDDLLRYVAERRMAIYLHAVAVAVFFAVAYVWLSRKRRPDGEGTTPACSGVVTEGTTSTP